MNNLNKTTASAALIALIAAAPMAALAADTGSPRQSVAADPNEYAQEDGAASTTDGSLEDTARTDQGEDAYEDQDVADDADGSLIEDDAKRDG